MNLAERCLVNSSGLVAGAEVILLGSVMRTAKLYNVPEQDGGLAVRDRSGRLLGEIGLMDSENPDEPHYVRSASLPNLVAASVFRGSEKLQAPFRRASRLRQLRLI